MKISIPKLRLPSTLKNRKGCLITIFGGGVLLIALIVVAIFIRRGNDAPTAPDMVAVERGNITVTLSGSGSVAAEQSLDLAFETSGQVENVLIVEGSEVERDDILALLETRELELSLADAEADVQSALAKLEQTKQGNATEQDIASAQASVNQAQVQLDQQIHGNATASDLASAQASLRSAQAQLNQQTVTNQANISSAESKLRAAEAKLADLEAGADPEELSSAQRTYDQALASYNSAKSTLEETRDRLSREKTKAKTTMDKASHDVQIVQSEYSIAYWRHEGVDEDDIIPSVTELPADTKQQLLTDYGRLTEDEAFVQAQLKLQNAEADLASAKTSYEQALNAERTGVFQAEQSLASAESQLRDAEIQLHDVQAGADDLDIIQAHEDVEQARIELNRLTGGGANADLAQRQASVDQAAAQVRQLQEGGSESDIASSQASLDQAKAQLEKLTASATDTDVRIQQAAVQQAENNLERARINLDNAKLVAPFKGIITNVDIVPGSVVGESTVAFNLIDRDPLHVDVTLNENDISTVEVGQKVDLTISALPDWQTTGTVTYVSPVSEADTDVVTYRVRVSFPDSDSRVKVGMTADLEIVTESKSDILVVPNTALTTRGERHVVLMMDPQSERPRPIQVKTGMTDGTHTEILSGLEEGQQIVANTAALESGTSTIRNQRGMFPFGGPPGGGPPPGSGGGSSNRGGGSR